VKVQSSIETWRRLRNASSSSGSSSASSSSSLSSLSPASSTSASIVASRIDGIAASLERWARIPLAVAVLLVAGTLPAAEGGETGATALETSSAPSSVVVSKPLGIPATASGFAPVHVVDVHQRVAPAVVGITCRQSGGEYFGSGVIVDPSGLVLTSTTVVPSGAGEIRVYLPGGRVARARSLLEDSDLEFSLIAIRDAETFFDRGGVGLPYVLLGESRDVRIGDPVFTLGNAFHSIQQDDQVTLAAGIVSGLLRLEEKRSESTYLGDAIEFTAALNNGMDGGPLVDRDFRLVGLLSLNFSRARWLGTAVPVHRIKPLIAKHRAWFDDRSMSSGTESHHGAMVGVELEAVAARGVSVLGVLRDGPAARAGLEAGDRVVAFQGRELKSLDEFRAALAECSPGSTVSLRILREPRLLRNSSASPVNMDMSSEEIVELSVALWGRF
jgi:S1-C subfamily serine protease